MRLTMSIPLPLPRLISSSTKTHHINHSSPSPTSQSQQRRAADSHNSTSPKLAPKNPTIRYRLSQLCRQGQPHLARQLFDAIPQQDTVLWNTIIIGFVCNDMPHEAIVLYSRMVWRSSTDTRCDPYTYSSTLKACAEARELRVGKAVHCHIIRSHFYPSKFVSNSLLNMYATCLSSVDEEMVHKNSITNDLVRKVFDNMRKRNVVAWNTMISWYVKTDRFGKAVEQFIMMMKNGIRPTPVSFVNIFPAVSRLGDIKSANVLYGLLLKMGSDIVNDMFVVSSAIFMYAELSCLDFARNIFDHCLEKNTEVWNTMISGYVQNDNPVEALDLFFKVLESSDSVVLDDVTFLSALTAASQFQHLEFAKQLHAYIVKSSALFPVNVSNAIIVMYSRCDSVETSSKFFELMQERDIVSWNTIITAFVQNGLDDEALMLVHEMQKQGFLVDSVTVTALLSAASNIRNREIGKQAHAYLLRHGIQFEGMESYLIDMYAKSGLVRAAQTVFEKKGKHDMDQATWNSMIAGNVQNGLIEEALTVFRQMIVQKFPPNAVTLASVIPTSNQVGSISFGKQLHAFSIRNSLEVNVFVGSALVDMYSKMGAIACAQYVFDKMPEKNSVTYTNMILGYGQHGMGEKAISLFNTMAEVRIKPDPITLVAVLSACSYTGLIDEGLEIFNSMESRYKIKPSTEHYCCVVDMLGRVGRVVEAYEFANSLNDERVNLLGIWGSLLGACRIHREFELGQLVAEKLMEMEGRDGIAGYHVLLSNMYAAQGKWENVNRVREGMLEKSLVKEVACSWIDTSGYVNYFVSKDQKHSRRDEIYELLEELGTQMKDDRCKSCYESQTELISESESESEE